MVYNLYEPDDRGIVSLIPVANEYSYVKEYNLENVGYAFIPSNGKLDAVTHILHYETEQFQYDYQTIHTEVLRTVMWVKGMYDTHPLGFKQDCLQYLGKHNSIPVHILFRKGEVNSDDTSRSNKDLSFFYFILDDVVKRVLPDPPVCLSISTISSVNIHSVLFVHSLTVLVDVNYLNTLFYIIDMFNIDDNIVITY